MIINLLNTLLLSASVSMGTINFKNELKPNREAENLGIQFNGTLTEQNKTSNTKEWQPWITHFIRAKKTTEKADIVYNSENTLIGIQGQLYNSYSEKWVSQNTYNYIGAIEDGEKQYLQTESQPYTKELRGNYNVNNEMQYMLLEITPLGIYRETEFSIKMNMKFGGNMQPRYIHYNIFKGTKLIDGTKDININESPSLTEVYRKVRDNSYNLEFKNEYINSAFTNREITLTTTIIANQKNYIYIFSQFVHRVQEYENVQVYDDNANLVFSGSKTAELYTNIYNTDEFGGSMGAVYFDMPTTEVVDIGGLTFTILGMPFTFISTAFNLTLFEGTQYAINISTLFLSIFAVIVFVFIVKLILGAIGNK